MSNPEQIVVSLEMAKRLKEAGWEQEGTFFHWICGSNAWREVQNIEVWEKIEGEWGTGREVKDLEHYSAPTAEEIILTLPKGWKFREQSQEEYISKNGDPYVKNGIIAVYYSWESQQKFPHEISCGEGNSLADSAAEMWLFLKKENLLPSEK